MNKILFIISDLEFGGAQNVLVNIANLLSIKNEVSILTLYDKATGNFKISTRIKVINLNFKIRKNIFLKIFDYFTLIFDISKRLSNYNPDKIISFLSTTNILVILSSFGFHKRLIISERNDIILQHIPMIWTILRRITYRFPSLISANSRNCLKQLESFTDKKKLIYLPNPILFQKKFKIRLCKKKIIAVGRLHHQKGFDILIKAFFKSKLYTRGWTLEIYGNGQLQYELDNLVKNFKLEKYIFLNSFITDIERIYNSASIFVMSSRFEGMPNVLLEAVSYKVPCIVSNKVRAAFEFLKHKESCLKFESENINDLKKNLENLTSKRILRKRIATKAFNQLNKYFSKKKILMEWKKIVE